MNIKKLIFIYLLLSSVTYLYSNDFASLQLSKLDSVSSDDDKIEYLIEISAKFEKINRALSLDAINLAYELATHSDLLMAKCDYQKGVVLSKAKDVEKALAHLKKALEYYEAQGDNSKSAIILIDIGHSYFNNAQYTKSILYYSSALSEFDKSGDSLNIVACYSYIGNANASLGNSDEAVGFFNNAVTIAQRNDFNYYLSYNLLKLSRLNLNSGMFDSVMYNVNIALNIAKKNHFNDLISEAYMLAVNYSNVTGNKPEALDYLNVFIQYTDSINRINNDELVSYVTSISNNELAKDDKYFNNLIFWVLIIVFVIILIFIIYKIIKQKNQFAIQINTITSELDAFKKRNYDVDSTVMEKTNLRINEIENQIIENKNLKVALADSLKNLNHVNNLKDIFLSKISHEIRTPLSGILGFSEILETELALLEDSTLYEFANSISQSGQSLVLLLNNILDISRLDSNNMKLELRKLNATELIQGVVDSNFQEASLKGVKLIYSPASVPDIFTDSQLFTKIISLILSNSIKFTEKGFVKISNYFDKSKGMIVISIKDTGIGIDKVYIDKVFEPFRQESLGYSTSYQGAGLGLPLAKKMTIKLNGEIEIASEKGSGTTVTLSFPAFSNTGFVQLKEVANKQEVKLSKFPWDTISVLVVEDDNMNQILYRKLLKTARYLEIAKDGKTALTVVENQIKNNNFQLVLMDINLPAPWDGISLMKEIRKKWPDYKNIPFIAQTAYAISGNRDAMLEEGFDEYITKPIIKSTLIDTIKKVID